MDSTQTTSQPSTLISLQYARAIASLLVVFSHLYGFKYLKGLVSIDFGGFGVDVFFVISGFIMWQTARNQTAVSFIRKRLVRIAPIYWFYTMLLCLIAVVAPHLAPRVSVSWSNLLRSLFFIPYENDYGQINPILLQGWTLNYEFLFYFVFSLALFAVRKSFRGAVITAILASIVFVAFTCSEESVIARFYASSIMFEFLIGMGICAATNRRRQANCLVGAFALAAALALIIAIQMQIIPPLPRVMTYGVSAGLFICGLVLLEPVLRTKQSRLGLAIGNSSYSLYLVHPFALSLTAKIFEKLTAGFHLDEGAVLSLAFASSAVALSLILAHASYLLLEVPTHRALSRPALAPASP